MTPALKPAKVEVIKTRDNALHVAMGLGPKTKLVVLILVEGGSK